MARRTIVEREQAPAEVEQGPDLLVDEEFIKALEQEMKLARRFDEAAALFEENCRNPAKPTEEERGNVRMLTELARQRWARATALMRERRALGEQKPTAKEAALKSPGLSVAGR